jgi:small subunit ribosomal protein S20
VPHHKSAKKRVRQTVKRTQLNKAKITMVKNALKKVRAAISTGDKATATSLLPATQKLLARLAKTGVIKQNTAARRTGRLASQINKL